MVVIRIIFGLAMMAGGCVGIYWTFREDGLGCLGAIASGIACLVLTLGIQIFPPDELKTFWGMDYVTLSEISGIMIILCIVFAESHIAGIIGCFILFFTGLLFTGFLDASTAAALSQYVGNAGWILFSPMLIPLALVIIFIAVI